MRKYIGFELGSLLRIHVRILCLLVTSLPLLLLHHPHGHVMGQISVIYGSQGFLLKRDTCLYGAGLLYSGGLLP